MSIIKVENLSKRYIIGHDKQATGMFRYKSLRDSLTHLGRSAYQRLRHPLSPNLENTDLEEFWALKDINFEINQGDRVGIIGRNGAGKSTLLKILSRITEPTTGKIQIKGRVASLLEVGTGFHPELSGRENIYLNGAVLGMTRAEIKRKFDEIVAFAEVEKFLDTPVKHYSSGMYVRLAFAVAAHLEPEILVVDEVLAVGDAEFQKKCLGKMKDVAKEGRTVIFVSHNMGAVRQLCNSALCLKDGCVSNMGNSNDIISFYLQQAVTETEAFNVISKQINSLPPDPDFHLRAIRISQNGVNTTSLSAGKPVDLEFEYDIRKVLHGMHVYFEVLDMEETVIFDSLNNGAEEHIPLTMPGRYRSKATIPGNYLNATNYQIRFKAGINCVRSLIPIPVQARVSVHADGLVNQAYPGYRSPGKLAPLIPWSNEIISDHLND